MTKEYSNAEIQSKSVNTLEEDIKKYSRFHLFLPCTMHLVMHLHLQAFKVLQKMAKYYSVQFSSVQFSCSVVSESLQPHEPQHSRPPCPSPTPGVHPNPCPSSQ